MAGVIFRNGAFALMGARISRLTKGMLIATTLSALVGCGGSSDSPTTGPVPPEATRVESKIVYIRNDDGSGTTTEHSIMHIMNPDGTETQSQVPAIAPDDSPSLSPNGSRIIFLSGRRGPAESRQTFARVPRTPTQLWVMNTDGSQLRRLTAADSNILSARFSPDGSKIVFVRDRDGKEEICVMNADGERDTVTTRGEYYDSVSSSPGGSQIVFSGRQGGVHGIHRMNADGTRGTRLATDASEPSFSPDAARIVFVRWVAGGREIHVMDADGSGSTQLTNGHDDSLPSFSPDGLKIIFNRRHVPGSVEMGARPGYIFMMDADGTNQTALPIRPNTPPSESGTPQYFVFPGAWIGSPAR